LLPLAQALRKIIKHYMSVLAAAYGVFAPFARC
jgi:hypothetical protein